MSATRNFTMHTLHRLCSAFALALGLSGAVLAQSQGMKTQDVKNLQTLQSAAVLSISPADTQALMQNFSRSAHASARAAERPCTRPSARDATWSRAKAPRAPASTQRWPPTPSWPPHPASVVMNGLHGMPSFASKLSDEQIADVVNYVRSNFGNQYPDKLSAADVKPFRVTP
jgi:hypothetical protein